MPELRLLGAVATKQNSRVVINPCSARTQCNDDDDRDDDNDAAVVDCRRLLTES